MTVVLERANLKITDVILSQKNIFTLEDVIEEISSKNVDVKIEHILETIYNLRDSGLINDYGNKYALSSLML